MANSFDSALVASTISTVALTALKNKLAPLRIFANDFSDEVKKAFDVVHVPLVTATGATSVNPTSFEPGGSTTVGKATVTLEHLFQPFEITPNEMGSGHRLETLVKINMNALGDKIWEKAITPITTTNFGNAVVTTTAITPGSGHLATLWATISKSDQKGLVLNPTIYSQLIPTSTLGVSLGANAYGFENGVYYASSFSGAVAGLDGFAVSPEAVGIAAYAPAIHPEIQGEFLMSDKVQLPDLGIGIYYNVWTSKSTRKVLASFEVMFGANAGITTGTAALII